MGHKLTVRRCYHNWTQAAIGVGETWDRGIDFEDTVSFRGLVSYLLDGGYCHLSSYPTVDGDTWIYTDGEMDYRSGDTEIVSLHLVTDSLNSHRNADKYWVKALKIVRSKF